MKHLTEILTCRPAARLVLDCFGRDLRLDECNRPNLKRLSLYMIDNVGRNSAKTYAAYIRSALNLHKDTEPIPDNFAPALRIRGEATISVYLTEEEIKRLYDAAKTQMERYYILHFAISSYEGCRVSDVKYLTEANITDGILRYVCRKTGAKAEVPARPELREWLSEIKTYDIKFCERTYNRYIKDLCEYAGIDDVVKVYRGSREHEDKKFNFVSSHTARRSFATNLYLRGYDIYTISKYMGHSSMEMTSRYICSGTRNMNDNFFNSAL